MLSFHILYLALVVVACATSLLASHDLDHVIDPLSSRSHGAIISPERVVFKVDCPDFPVFDDTCDRNATALIYDFTLEPSSLLQILLNNDAFYTWRGIQALTRQATIHTALSIAPTLTIDDYIDTPGVYKSTSIGALTDSDYVPNAYGWDVIRIKFTTLVFVTSKNESLAVPTSDFTTMELFLLKMPQAGYSTSFELRDAKSRLNSRTRNNQDAMWTIEWWQIVPQALLQDIIDEPKAEPFLPGGLTDKLLERGEPSGDTWKSINNATIRGRSIDIITIAFTLIVILGILVIAAIVVGLIVPVALALSRKYAPPGSRGNSESDGERESLLGDEEGGG